MHEEIQAIPLSEQLNMLFRYCPKTGALYWKPFITTNPRKWGKLATRRYDSYLSVNVARANYPAHRLVWCMNHGEWPPGLISHANGDRTDNRLENLHLGKNPNPAQQAARDAIDTPRW